MVKIIFRCHILTCFNVRSVRCFEIFVLPDITVGRWTILQVVTKVDWRWFPILLLLGSHCSYYFQVNKLLLVSENQHLSNFRPNRVILVVSYSIDGAWEQSCLILLGGETCGFQNRRLTTCPVLTMEKWLRHQYTGGPRVRERSISINIHLKHI